MSQKTVENRQFTPAKPGSTAAGALSSDVLPAAACQHPGTASLCGRPDPELVSYVAAFLREVGATLKPGPLNLETPESAAQARAAIQSLQAEVARHRRTAAALTQLLNRQLC